ncbi:MAG TPA: HAMP domain-containing sensor histidine kinase [Methanoregula sp.]|nr:HAMP domain-containing sensor histidine kinase [Methanoregula sp.]
MQKEMRNARLLTILFIVMMVVITVGSFTFVTTLARDTIKDGIRQNLKSTAAIISGGVDGDRLAAIRPGDEGTPAFLSIRDYLDRVRNADPTIEYIYTMRQNGSAVEFVVDGDYGIARDGAAIGDVYPNATQYLLQGFTGPSADLDITTDQWGDTLSGYAPIRDSGGHVVGLVGVDRDSRGVAAEMDRISTANDLLVLLIIGLFATGAIVFDIRRTRAETITRRANEDLNMLNGIIRHDIFNTLTGLIGYIGMAEQAETVPELKEKLVTISALSEKIREQIAFTRDYQDLGMKRPVWQDVGAVIREQSSPIRFGEVQLCVELSGLEIYADPLLGRVFYQLLKNSVVHGNTVTRINVSAVVSGDAAVIVIEDDGVGIPAARKAAIFDRRATGTTGLGLFIVKEILSLTGITIAETGVPGRGARFEIRVPKGRARIRETRGLPSGK